MGIFSSTKALQAVSRMFQELIRVEFGNESSGETFIQDRLPPRAQSTPDRQLQFSDTFTRVFPGGQLNSTFTQPRAGNATFTRNAGGNVTFTRGHRNQTFTRDPLNATYTMAGTENRTFDISSQQQRQNPFEIPQIVVDTPTEEVTFDERLSNSARSLNQTVAQLVNTTTPTQSPNRTFEMLPSQTRAAMNARARSRIPKFRKLPRKIDFM